MAKSSEESSAKALSTVDDDEIRKELWKGTIPIQFVLSANEVSTLKPPQPFYMLAPRQSYLPLVSTNVKSHFLSSAAAVYDEMWFEYKGKPLKWHYPIGVLFDTLVGSSSAEALPWCLIVHFQGFPAEQILRCNSETIVRSYISNVIKEATSIKFGDCSKINNMSVNDSNDFWEGLKNNDFGKFWTLNSKLLPESVASLRNIPLRLFVNNSAVYIQEPVSAVDEHGSLKTLEMVFQELLPMVMGPNAPTPNLRNISYSIQGISPPLETPVVWLSDNLSYADNFLYIIVSNAS